MHSKTLKILIGILTALFIVAPFFLVLFVMGFSFLPLIPILFSDSAPPEAFFLIFSAMPFFMIPTIFCFNILVFGLQVFYTVQIIKNRQISDTPRILFILGLFFAPFIAMPLFYLLYYWKDAPQTALAEA